MPLIVRLGSFFHPLLFQFWFRITITGNPTLKIVLHRGPLVLFPFLFFGTALGGPLWGCWRHERSMLTHRRPPQIITGIMICRDCAVVLNVTPDVV